MPKLHLNWANNSGVCCSSSFYCCACCTCGTNTVVRYDPLICEVIQEKECEALLYSCIAPLLICSTNECAKLVRLEKRKFELDLTVITKYYFSEKTITYHGITQMKVERWEATASTSASVAITITFGKNDREEIIQFFGARLDPHFTEFNINCQKMLSNSNPSRISGNFSGIKSSRMARKSGSFDVIQAGVTLSSSSIKIERRKSGNIVTNQPGSVTVHTARSEESNEEETKAAPLNEKKISERNLRASSDRIINPERRKSSNEYKPITDRKPIIERPQVHVSETAAATKETPRPIQQKLNLETIVEGSDRPSELGSPMSPSVPSKDPTDAILALNYQSLKLSSPPSPSGSDRHSISATTTLETQSVNGSGRASRSQSETNRFSIGALQPSSSTGRSSLPARPSEGIRTSVSGRPSLSESTTTRGSVSGKTGSSTAPVNSESEKVDKKLLTSPKASTLPPPINMSEEDNVSKTSVIDSKNNSPRSPRDKRELHDILPVNVLHKSVRVDRYILESAAAEQDM
jgi:hypothetical protein